MKITKTGNEYMKRFIKSIQIFFGIEPGYRTLKFLVRVQHIPESLRGSEGFDFASIYDTRISKLKGIAYVSPYDYKNSTYEIGYFEQSTSKTAVLRQFQRLGISLTLIA